MKFSQKCRLAVHYNHHFRRRQVQDRRPAAPCGKVLKTSTLEWSNRRMYNRTIYGAVYKVMWSFMKFSFISSEISIVTLLMVVYLFLTQKRSILEWYIKISQANRFGWHLSLRANTESNTTHKYKIRGSFLCVVGDERLEVPWTQLFRDIKST